MASIAQIARSADAAAWRRFQRRDRWHCRLAGRVRRCAARILALIIAGSEP